MRNSRFGVAAKLRDERGTRNLAFLLLCALVVSYFLHLTNRIPVLGNIRLDFLLGGASALAIAFSRGTSATRMVRGEAPAERMDPVTRRLWILVGYILVTIPFVEWPGSVLHNLEPFGKSLFFYFLVLATVDTTAKLRALLMVYVATQAYRILEPLFMHLRSGYWGSATSIGHWEMMDRLSGSPWDVVNPNGLAFLIILTLPMLHFLVRPNSFLRGIVWATLAGAMCYALLLTASRSGMLAFVFLCLLLAWRSRHRAAWLAVAVLAGIVAASLMTELQKGRYLSIVSERAPGAVTAQERIEGVAGDFKVSLRRPFFGHGLGTSREANSHFRNEYLPSHNLYAEAAEELGYVGLVLLLALIWSFLRACLIAQQLTRTAGTADQRLQFLHRVGTTLVVVVAVDMFFSFASYGLSEPYWYFYGGVSVVTARLALNLSPGRVSSDTVAPAAGRANRRVGGRRFGRLPESGRMPIAARPGPIRSTHGR